MRRIISAVVLCSVFGAGIAAASWYDDYDAGLNAIKAGQWKSAADKMSSAIAGNGKESNNARTYGAIFINYHPYYYRAVAYINLGQYAKAVSDLEKTTGPGPIDRGSIDVLMDQARKGAETPVTAEAPRPPAQQPAPVEQPRPAPPSIDNTLRGRARAALDEASNRLKSARDRRANGTPEYRRAEDRYVEANSRWGSAKSNDDLNAVLAEADNIKLLADSATAAATPAVVTAPPLPPTTTGRIVVATENVLSGMKVRLRNALQDYFNGDFDRAQQEFEGLAREMPRNPWIWAFLGASQYSQYAFEGGDSFKDAAMTSFRKARTYGKWKNGLPEKYFSRRIRNAFKQIAG